MFLKDNHLAIERKCSSICQLHVQPWAEVTRSCGDYHGSALKDFSRSLPELGREQGRLGNRGLVFSGISTNGAPARMAWSPGPGGYSPDHGGPCSTRIWPSSRYSGRHRDPGPPGTACSEGPGPRVRD